MGPGMMRQSRVPLSQLANLLSGRVERPVEDRTGLSGVYAFDLRWTAERFVLNGRDHTIGVSAGELTASIFTALREQLGLKLEPIQTTAEFLIIDRVERPTPN